MDHNWLTDKAEARPAGEKGWGSFAVEQISAGETVAAFGGWAVPGHVLTTLPVDRQSRSIQIDDDLYMVSDVTPEAGDMLNHACEPNCGISGSVILVAVRDIAVGEELSFDYAMCDASDYDEFDCLCGGPTCRGIVRGTDWRDPVLQEKYAGFFSSYLVKRIAELPALS